MEIASTEITRDKESGKYVVKFYDAEYNEIALKRCEVSDKEMARLHACDDPKRTLELVRGQVCSFVEEVLTEQESDRHISLDRANEFITSVGRAITEVIWNEFSDKNDV